LFGLVSDALLSARVVTANGRLVQVSENENPELFWGLRGAGANLGVVTSATYKAHKLVNQGQIMNVDLAFPANMSRKYFDVVASYGGKMPANLAGVTFINYDKVAQAVSRGPIPPT
jgi:FAD/FMN-containing dehydrogenase